MIFKAEIYCHGLKRRTAMKIGTCRNRISMLCIRAQHYALQFGFTLNSPASLSEAQSSSLQVR